MTVDLADKALSRGQRPSGTDKLHLLVIRHGQCRERIPSRPRFISRSCAQVAKSSMRIYTLHSLSVDSQCWTERDIAQHIGTK